MRGCDDVPVGEGRRDLGSAGVCVTEVRGGGSWELVCFGNVLCFSRIKVMTPDFSSIFLGLQRRV